MKKKVLLITYSVVLVGRIFLIFADALLAKYGSFSEIKMATQGMLNQHSSAEEQGKVEIGNKFEISENYPSDNVGEGGSLDEEENKSPQPPLSRGGGLHPSDEQTIASIVQELQEDIEPEEKTVQEMQDSKNKIAILEQAYSKQKEKEGFNDLVNGLVQEYEFKKAWKHLEDVDPIKDRNIDPNMYIYVYFNNLSLMSSKATTKFRNELSELKGHNLISSDSALFYQAMCDLWEGNTTIGLEKLDRIVAPMYKEISNNLNEIESKIEKQRDIPIYYQDALFGLELFKQGYFSVAKKMSLKVLNENPDYILPYQVLAYSNYLTNNWDSSVEYFYKLIDLEPSKNDAYKFMIGSSHYWAGSYTDSLLHLSQIKSPELQTDIYRYQILNYLAIEDDSKLMQTWKKSLGEGSLNKDDFLIFFDNVLFEPYTENVASSLYNIDRQTVLEFVNLCSSKIDDINVCDLGQAGLDMIQHNWKKLGLEDELVSLSEKFDESYIYKALGDINKYKNDLHKAKDYYLQAVSLSDLDEERDWLKDTLRNLFK